MSAPGFAGTPMTKREVLIARQAYDAGYDAGIGDRGTRPLGWRGVSSALYPLPKVTRPRLWLEPQCDGGMAWRVIDGELQHTLSLRPDLLNWTRVDPRTCDHEITPARIRAWADLLANPTEEVEE